MNKIRVHSLLVHRSFSKGGSFVEILFRGNWLSFAVILFLFSFIALLATFTIIDPDTPQYLAHGRYIAGTGLQQGCVFSYTLRDCTVNYNEWLWHVLVYGVYVLGSWEGLVVFQASIVVGTYVLAYLACRARGASRIATGVIFLLSSFVAMERFMLRADTWGLLLVAGVFYLMTKIDLENDKQETENLQLRSKHPHLLSHVSRLIQNIKLQIPFIRNWKLEIRNLKFIFPLFFLFALWSNTHSLFILGLAIVGCFFVSRLFADLRRHLTGTFQGVPLHACKETPFGPKTKLLALVLGGCILASMVNPYGLKGFLFPMQFMFSMGAGTKPVIRSISEYESPFAPAEQERLSLKAYKALLAVAAVLLVVNMRREVPSGTSSDLLLLGGFTFLSFQAVRHIALFAVMAAMVLPLYLDRLLARLPGRLSLGVYALAAGTVILVCIMVGKDILSDDFYIRDGRTRQFGLGVSTLNYPEGAARFIRDVRIPGQMFNSYEFGGYFHWALFPQYKTFMHGSVLDPQDLESIELYRYYQDINTGQVPYHELDRTFGINFFVLNHGNGITETLIKKLYGDPGWKLIYLDHTAVIFIKQAPENAAIIDAHKISLASYDTDRLIDRYHTPVERAVMRNGLGNLFAKLGLLEQAEHQYKASISDNPDHYADYNNLAQIYSRRRDYEKAIEMYRRSLAVRPDLPSTHFYLAQAYLLSGKIDLATDYYRIVKKMNPNFPEIDTALQMVQEIKKERNKQPFLSLPRLSPP